jgi:type IV secretion system protein TrbC
MSQNAWLHNIQSHRRMIAFVLLFAFIGWLLLCGHAHASEAGTGLEWETPFQAFYRSITGPIAFGVAFLGMCVCGFVLIWGGEINEFVRRMVMVILVIAIIMFAGNILRRMFAGGAATITPVATQTIGDSNMVAGEAQ